jgi:hypothetical protein
MRLEDAGDFGNQGRKVVAWLFDASLLAPVSERTDNASEAANRTILLMIEASLTCEAHE